MMWLISALEILAYASIPVIAVMFLAELARPRERRWKWRA